MFGHGVFDVSRSFRNEEYDYSCWNEDATPPVKRCYEKLSIGEGNGVAGCYATQGAYNDCLCKCNDNPFWLEQEASGEYTGSTEMPSFTGGTSPDDGNGNGNGGGQELKCDSADCPPNHVATKKTDANGKESCECVDAQAVGDGIKAIGTGLALLAVGGVVTTGLIGYAIYRIIRG
tara:strand:+ start:270 stop:797 length:528 start_codon:yes stop_codon:yes gene_type:complete